MPPEEPGGQYDSFKVPFVSKNHSETVFTFRGISYKISKKLGANPILDNVSGTFRSGRLAAIIGHRGSGKTSLLNVLSGFRSTGIEGSTVINDEIFSQRDYRQIVGYSPKGVALLPNLTVRETLEYALELRSSSKGTQNQKSKTIQGIISLMGLQNRPRSRVRVLTRVEQMRLSIGQDLVTEPSVVLLDEPTSGLDSESQYEVLSYLKDIADQDRCVIVVVHQPSSDMLELFDDIYVLSNGRCLYEGNLEGMVPHFENMGFVCPQYFNRVEFVMKITPLNISGIGEIIQTEHLMEYVNNQQIPRTSFSEEPKSPSRYPISTVRQLAILTQRTTVQSLRHSSLHYGGLLVFNTLMGVAYYGIGNDAAKVISNTAFLTLTQVVIVFTNSMATVLNFPIETKVLIREYKSNCYSVTAYFFSKFVADLVPIFVGTSCCQAIGYFMTAQPKDFERIMAYCIILCLTGWVGHVYGLLVSCAFSGGIAPFIVPVTLLPMMLFGGFFIRFGELSAVLRPLIHVSPFKYAFEGVALAIYGANRTDLACSDGGGCYYRNGEQVLEMLGMEGAVYLHDVVGLSVTIVLLYVLVFMSLLLKVK